MNLKLRRNNLLLFLMLLLSILPIINIGSFGLPILYLLIPLEVVLLVLVLFGKIKIPKITKTIFLIFILIIIEIFISTLYGTISSFGRFIVPTDTIQYVARFLILLTFILVFYNGKVDADVFIKYFLIALNIAMLIGILQWIPWPGREFFINLYPYREGIEQLSQLSRSMNLIRVHGFAQMATANGGLSAFFFVFAYSVYKYYKKYRFLATTLIVFSIINIFASQARAGMLAFVCAIALFYVINVYITKRSFKSTFYFITFVFSASFIVWILYKNGNPFLGRMLYRWDVLLSTGGGVRVDNIKYFLQFFNEIPDYLFGISKAVQNNSALSYGVEIEPINILIIYGLSGFLLQYSLVSILLIYFCGNIRQSKSNKSLTLLVSAFIGLFSYQIFSVGYFFFREIRVGLFPWILMGVAIGVYERESSIRRATK